MKTLITEKPMSYAGILIAVLALIGGYAALIYGIAFIGIIGLLLGGIIGLWALFGKDGLKEVFGKPKGKPTKTIFIWFGVSLLVAFASIIVVQLLHVPTSANPLSGNINVIVLLKTIPALLGEEMFFVVTYLISAKLVYSLIKNYQLAMIVGVLISSLLFGSLHLPTYNWHFFQAVILIGLVRIPFSIASIKTDRVWCGFAIHVMYDWSVFIIGMLSMSLIK